MRDFRAGREITRKATPSMEMPDRGKIYSSKMSNTVTNIWSKRLTSRQSQADLRMSATTVGGCPLSCQPLPAESAFPPQQSIFTTLLTLELGVRDIDVDDLASLFFCASILSVVITLREEV
jgi:hypothetical protein